VVGRNLVRGEWFRYEKEIKEFISQMSSL